MWGVEGEGDGEGNVRSDEEREEGECEEWRVSERVEGECEMWSEGRVDGDVMSEV